MQGEGADSPGPGKGQVFFWRRKTKQTTLEHSETKKHTKGAEKTPKAHEPPTVADIMALKEAKSLKLDESSNMTESCVVTKTAEDTQVELSRGGPSLLQLPWTAVQSVSTLMVSALQSGWQMCTWKSSVSSASIPSQMRPGSPLESPEAEMLREVYLVLWAIRKQLRQLARRQERRRRRHVWRASPQPDPAWGPKQDAQSPL
ncbi:uncharacterized protein C7orf61 homolog isoform X2 [Choloepus didactylus]|uniref:uncharacterized protein C7orf61 homolog isoform X2 n=1 Tax=Choloepus didactylus TaxID=27675 RepID=UPI00189C765A|nr:uncharacterized protein C7orf61 homolog isoform X2 [Choloepus didactylus]